MSCCPTCGKDLSGRLELITINGFTFEMCYSCREDYKGWKQWNKIVVGMAGRKGKAHRPNKPKEPYFSPGIVGPGRPIHFEGK